jgi:hypothetical protein
MRASLPRSLSLAAALLLVGCLHDSTSPGHGGVARLAVAPVFQTRSALLVSFNRVRITLSREVGTALDTLVSFPPGADSVVITLLVPITGSSETLTLDLAMINAAGDTVFRGGPVPVLATTGVISRGAPLRVDVRYVGVGANARSVLIATRTASVFFRDSVQLTAAALDSSGEPIPGTPIVWRSLDTTLARVPADSTGKVIGGTARGVARIQAALLTLQTDTARVTVQPVAAALSLVSGGGQTGTVGAALASPVVARVKAADSLGVSGVWVHFAVTAGGGAPSADSVLTDSLGRAQVQWTLGPTAGPQALQASLPGVPGATVSYAATAVAGAPKTLVFTVPPTGAVAGAPIAPAVVVSVLDSLGNPVAAFGGSVTVAITTGTGTTGAALRGTKTVPATGGAAAFVGLSIDSAATGYTLTATSTGLPDVTSAAFAITPGPPVALAFTTQPPASTVYQTSFGFTVTAKDSLGNDAPGFSGAVSVAIGNNPAGGTLSGTLTQTASASVANFSGISLDNLGTGYTLRAGATGLTTATSAAVNVVAPPGVNAWVNTAGGNWSVASNWSKGAVPVATDTVAIKQSGTYTVTLNVNATVARLDVGAPLGVPTLAFNGFKMAVTGNFSTLAGGVIRMASALDSLGTGGNATFGGGAGTLSAGTISVAGNFIQSGAANSFAPTGTTVILTGSAVSQAIRFTDATNSFFRRLQISKTAGGVVLTANARASFFRVVSATAVTGSAARLFTDTVYSPNTSSSITPLAVEIRAVLGDSGAAGFAPDTTVFTGASQVISANNTGLGTYGYKSIRVAQSSGTATLATSLALPNDLVVASGALSLNRFGVAVAGNFRTEASGVLAMTSPTDSLGVAGNVTFGGGSTAGTLTSGLITVAGNFTQTGTGAVFAPTGTHRVRFARGTAGVQTVQFADPTNSFFHDLVLNPPGPAIDTVRLLSSVQVQDSAIVTGFSVLASTTLEALHLPATGVLRIPRTTAVLRPSLVEFGTLQVDSPFTGGVTVTPDTAVFLNGGSITSGSPGYGWKSVRLAGGALTSSGTRFSGNLIVSAGTYTPPISGAVDSVGGFFRTESSGVLVMPVGTVPPTLAVRDSAVFAGGSEAGQLVSGTLRINGNFAQRGPTTTSFQAGGGHVTQFEGSTRQSVTFATPGAALSTFNTLLLARASGGLAQSTRITLGSPIFVAGTVQDTSAGAADSIIGGGNGVTTNGFSLSNTVFSNAPVVVTNSTQLLSGNVVTFTNMSPTAVQLTMSRSSGTITLAGFAFLVAPTGAGLYFSATSLATAGPVTYSFTSPVQPPAASPPSVGQYLRLGAPPAVVVWGTTTLP